MSEAEKALSSNGLNLTSVQAAARPATDVAQQAVDKATPFVFRVFDFVTHSDVAGDAVAVHARCYRHLPLRELPPPAFSCEMRSPTS